MKCPYCGESIQDDALKCRYCREWLGERPSELAHSATEGARVASGSSAGVTNGSHRGTASARWEAVFGEGASYVRTPEEEGRHHEAIYGPRPRPKDGASAGSGSAVTALVLGIVGLFVPVVLSVLAIIFAGVGINSADTRGAPRNGMAIAGLVLGLVGAIGWSVFLGIRLT
jgi:hypothetical protein